MSWDLPLHQPAEGFANSGMMMAMAYWWAQKSDENIFMEITRRDDIGADLKAPLAARGGVETSGYALVNEVKLGDVVIHYNSSSEQIVGVSRATGERWTQPIWWAARGSYARKAGAKPKWLPGITIGLGSYETLIDPLPLSVIRSRRAALLGLRDALQAEHPEQAIYFPWIPYQDTLRTFQTYLAKFPRAALDVLPELRNLVDRASRPRWQTVESGTVQVEEVIATAAGRPREPHRPRGQGFAVDQLAKVAVETHAMNAALAHYRTLGDVVDTSRTQSYDYQVLIDGRLWHVEVKGTTGDPTEVLLTPKEVEHASTYPNVGLYVMSRIVVQTNAAGEVSASGGEAMILHPWRLNRSELTALGFRYRLPEGS